MRRKRYLNLKLILERPKDDELIGFLKDLRVPTLRTRAIEQSVLASAAQTVNVLDELALVSPRPITGEETIYFSVDPARSAAFAQIWDGWRPRSRQAYLSGYVRRGYLLLKSKPVTSDPAARTSPAIPPPLTLSAPAAAPAERGMASRLRASLRTGG